MNTASRCGYTPQYKGLEALHEKYSKDGLAVLGFPCNQFGRQEPGTAQQNSRLLLDEVQSDLRHVREDQRQRPEKGAALQMARIARGDSVDPGPVGWNFEKFLVGRDGKVIARFRSADKPESPKVVAAIETALQK